MVPTPTNGVNARVSSEIDRGNELTGQGFPRCWPCAVEIPEFLYGAAGVA